MEFQEELGSNGGHEAEPIIKIVRVTAINAINTILEWSKQIAVLIRDLGKAP